ncbi:hypothetical protein [Spirosoma utsteinense]|nr:hypothetical protein [Spirosoma utsteinense]
MKLLCCLVLALTIVQGQHRPVSLRVGRGRTNTGAISPPVGFAGWIR